MLTFDELFYRTTIICATPASTGRTLRRSREKTQVVADGGLNALAVKVFTLDSLCVVFSAVE